MATNMTRDKHLLQVTQLQVTQLQLQVTRH